MERADRHLKGIRPPQSQSHHTVSMGSRLTEGTRKGRFAIANRIPSSLNLTKHFTGLQNQREVFGRLVQCRTGYAYMGEFRKQFFPEKNVDCECGEEL